MKHEIEVDRVKGKEVAIAMKWMKKGKTGGPDDMQTEAWKGRTAAKWLMEVYRNITKTGHMPDEWRASILIPIL